MAVGIGESVGSAIGRTLARVAWERVSSGPPTASRAGSPAPPRHCSSSGSPAACWRSARAAPDRGRPDIDRDPDAQRGPAAARRDRHRARRRSSTPPACPRCSSASSRCRARRSTRPPTRRRAAIAELAEASTLRISAATCGSQSSGSWRRRGATGVRRHERPCRRRRHGPRDARHGRDRGDRSDAARRPVRPGARCRGPARAGPAGACRSGSRPPIPDAATVGAALGYPGGGGLTIVPAAVTGAYAATGRDIYGEADRRPRQSSSSAPRSTRGDSGGPFVLRDGTIGGLVFAEARTDPDVGYALSPDRRWHADRAGARPDRTPSTPGSCLR